MMICWGVWVEGGWGERWKGGRGERGGERRGCIYGNWRMGKKKGGDVGGRE